MAVPDLAVVVRGYCRGCGRQAVLTDTDGWVCDGCGWVWDAQGEHGRQTHAGARDGTDRATDSTSGLVLDRPQPDVDPDRQ